MARTQVQSELIATNAISGTIIADNAITATHIATNAISGTLVQSSGITTDMIAANNVTAAKIVSDGVETRHLHSNVISGQSSVTAASGDYLLIGDTSDSNNLKKALVSDIGVTGIASSADATAITIDSSENVGIGTGSPTQTLDVRGGSGTGTHTHAIFTGTTGRGLQIRSRSDVSGGQHSGCGEINAADSEGDGGDLAFSSNGNIRMFIDGTGKVGIGTSSPTSSLHLTSTTANTNGMVRFQNNMDNNYETLRIESLGDYDAHIGFFADGSSNYYWGAGVDYSDSGKFKIANDNLLATNTRLTITTGGDVGIGTTSPDDKLDIMGGGYDQIRIGSNKTDNTNKTAGIVSTMYTNNSVSFMQGFFQNGNNAVYYGSADGAHRGLQNHYFYVNSNYNATSGHTLAMQINSSGQMTRPTHPAFHAYGPSSATSGADVIYQNTYVNTGNHYSTSNGRFTAPVAGVYLFFWSAIGNSTNDVYRFFLRVNGSSTISGSSNDIHLRQDTLGTGSEYATNGSRVQMLSLSASDYVQIYFAADGSTSHYVQSDYSNFGGYLIG